MKSIRGIVYIHNKRLETIMSSYKTATKKLQKAVKTCDLRKASKYSVNVSLLYFKGQMEKRLDSLIEKYNKKQNNENYGRIMELDKQIVNIEKTQNKFNSINSKL